LADAVIEVLCNPEMARSFGQAGRAWQREAFTSRRMADETARVYEEVMASVTEPLMPAMAAARR
jgi:glycosyltransferase involved in cell wall biosynthesis